MDDASPDPDARRKPDPVPLGFRGGLPVGLQVFLGVGILVGLAVLTGSVAIALLIGLRGDQARLNDSNVPFATAVASAALHAKGVANDERGYLLTGDQRFVDEMDVRLLDARNAFATASALAATPTQRIAVAAARDGFERWMEEVEEELTLYRAGHSTVAIDIALGPHRAVRHAYERELAHAQVLAEGALREDASALTAASHRSVRFIIVLVVLAVVLGSGVAVWVTRTILRPVYSMIRLATTLSHGADGLF
jgi:methyl-accepting chemotaxis protein